MACNNDTSKKFPKMIELLEELAPIAYKFKIFGTLLNIKTYVLEEIDQSSRDCKEKLYKVLEHRLNLMPPLTWQDAVRALRSPVLDKQSLAYQIESNILSLLPCRKPARLLRVLLLALVQLREFQIGINNSEIRQLTI